MIQKITNDFGKVLPGLFRLPNGAISVKNDTEMEKHQIKKAAIINDKQKILDLEDKIEKLTNLVNQLLTK